MVDAAALAAGTAAGVVLFVVAAVVVCLSDGRFRRLDGKIAAMWWRNRPPATGEKGRKDLEKGQPTARVADGPDHPEEETKKLGEEDDGWVDATSLPSVRKFGWTEVEKMTEKFSTVVIGEGGFSTVYLGRLGSTAAAVKVHSSSSGSERLHRAFRQELEVLLRLRHPHIVRLIGYCDEREEGALVLEYISNGTLHEKLHGEEASEVLPWAARMNIALQIAQAVEHLHDRCGLPIVHCDLKASNVLIDQQLNAKLCDFGSALAGFKPTVAATSMMGSPGYMDPHYLRTGVVSKKGDVYSFGVLLLELLTGGEAFCSDTEQLLAASVGRALAAELVEEILDPRLGSEYNREEAAAVAAVAARCIAEQPCSRPAMTEIVSSIGRTTKKKPS